MTFPTPSDAPAAAPNPSFDGLLEVRCPVTVLLGTGHASVRECLALAPGSVLRLAQTAGQDVELQVNGVVVARGEVVVLGESTAVRLTEIAGAPRPEPRA
jgi:flagellar motor switch protein FliN/FliY